MSFSPSATYQLNGEAGGATYRGGFVMCYNCGCGMPNNDMGNPNNITNQTFKRAAEATKQPLHVAKKNAHALLEKILAAKQASDDKIWKP